MYDYTQFARPHPFWGGSGGRCFNGNGKVCSFMAKEYKLSPQRLKELQDELTYLKTVREKEVEIGRAHV